jgi:protein O-mannosyl-transferase
MTGAFWQSDFVVAMFAFHPLNVESVAWIAERKNVLSTLFWLMTMWAYTHY